MDQNLFTRWSLLNDLDKEGLYAFVLLQRKVKLRLKRTFLFLNILFFILLSSSVQAQETLMGATSNGGTQGKGTLFSIRTNAASFAVVRAFSDWGKNPNGNMVRGNDGNYYGMTFSGGTFGLGTIFRITPTGSLTILRHLNSLTDGANPYGSLTLGVDGNFYGLTSSGGTNSYGVIFKITSAGVFTVLRHLSITADGGNPQGNLVAGTDGNFYGITRRGGSSGFGTIFKITPTGVYTIIKTLINATDGGTCYGSLANSPDGNFYGITSTGGTFSNGTIFKVTPAGIYTVLRHMKFTTDGASNANSLVSSADGFLYGVCYFGGTTGQGTIFKINRTTNAFTVLRNLSSLSDGSNPRASLIVGADGNLYGTNSAGGASNGGTIFKISTIGAFTVLRSLLVATDGGKPAGALFRGTDGSYYGMNNDGGSNLYGTIFKISSTGTYTVLTRLNGGITANQPQESVAQGIDFGYYGTTLTGGMNDQGTIFKICGGVYSLLRSFKSTTDGGLPKGSLLQASDGNFYGVTSTGGTSNAGTIFKITPSGTFTVLRNLVGPSDGSVPQGSLIQGTDNFLYGLTSAGGTGGGGTVFKISTAGVFRVIRQLVVATDGANPEGNLIKGAGGADSLLYGMTKSRIFKISQNGIIFTILRTLNAATDGNLPLGSLVRATDGNFYGTNSSGGNFSNSGTIFKITPAGVYTVLRHLNPTTDGGNPKGNMTQAADGFLYGLTSAGGTNKAGTIFRTSTAGAFSILRHFNLLTDGGNPFGSLIIQTTLPLVANPQSLSTTEDLAKAVVLTGSGATPLTFRVSTNPRNGTFTGTGANWTYTPNANFNGKDSLFFTSNFSCAVSPPAKIVVTVTSVNDAPVLAAIGNKSVIRGALLTFTATATDADAGQTKAFSLITPPVGATINASTGVFNWTPASAGSFTFKVRVTDNGSPILFDEEQITVTVAAALIASSTLSETKRDEDIFLNKAGLYPNPVSDKLMVTIDQPDSRFSGIIVNVNGAVVKRFSAGNINDGKLEIEVSDLSPGTYVVKFNSGVKRRAMKFLKL